MLSERRRLVTDAEVLQVDLARDCPHLAVMERHGIETILTFHSGFDGFPGIKCLPSGGIAVSRPRVCVLKPGTK